ncbi:MAG: crossover junction endodeoxyribonuclease RuvC [Gemmataceae bacterium]
MIVTPLPPHLLTRTFPSGCPPMPLTPTPPPPAAPSRRILGLDPGLQTTGYGVLEPGPHGPRVCEAGVIRSAAERAETDMSRRVRLLYDGLLEVLDQWRPAVVAVEQLFAHYDHPRTAVLMAHARGVYLLAAAQRGIPVLSYAPARVKKTVTGHGRATKEQMQAAVARELGLAKPPEPHDVADALAIALCHYHRTAVAGIGTGVNRERLFGPDEAA